MQTFSRKMSTLTALPLVLAALSNLPAQAAPGIGNWTTVVNNADLVPDDPSLRTFNSYNQPSVNNNQLVVFRARSKGGEGGEPAHGVYTRDMQQITPALRIFDRNTLVPAPNNLQTTFVEPPSFPRIDQWTDTVASRGNHQPVWRYVVGTDPQTGEDIETRVGTTGIYANPAGFLLTAASNVGAAPGYEVFAVPGILPPIKFDVFPGAPAVTGDSTLVFKGNYTLPEGSRTGVYYRDFLYPSGETQPAIKIADSHSTLIPGTTTVFGSTAPPSAAAGKAVFAGFDNEDSPKAGGIYQAPVTGEAPVLTPLVQIGDTVPGQKNATFTNLGEGLAFDGRFVAFWGAWGPATKNLVLQCREEGNQARVEYCKQQYPRGFKVKVPEKQGIFVHDTVTSETLAVATSPADFSDFVYWNFSGLVPGTGAADDASEPARWRSASFVAVSGLVDGDLADPHFDVVFKARTAELVKGVYVDPVDGIYLRGGAGAAEPALSALVTVVASGTDGTAIDPAAIYDDDANPATAPVPLPVTEMGIERDGLRGANLVLNVSMGTEEAGWAGIYLTQIITTNETE